MKKIWPVQENDEISERLNKFFADILKNLHIPQYEDHLVYTNNIDGPILWAKEKFKNHLIKLTQLNPIMKIKTILSTSVT